MKKSYKSIISICTVLFIILTSFSGTAIKISKESNESDESPTMLGSKYALIIGTGMVSCPYSDYDARDMKNALVKNGWNSLNIKTLIGLTEATKNNILSSIKIWLDARENSNDLVLIFFSGHGKYNKIIAANVIEGIDPEKIEITGQELDEAVSQLESQKIVLIFDSCFSGSFTDIINPLSKPGRIILTACNSVELSRSDTNKLNGIFTYHLVNALNFADGTDKDNDKKISAREAFNYANVRTLLQLQNPQSYYGADADLIIAKKSKAKDKESLEKTMEFDFLKNRMLTIFFDKLRVL